MTVVCYGNFFSCYSNIFFTCCSRFLSKQSLYILKFLSFKDACEFFYFPVLSSSLSHVKAYALALNAANLTMSSDFGV